MVLESPAKPSLAASLTAKAWFQLWQNMQEPLTLDNSTLKLQVEMEYSLSQLYECLLVSINYDHTTSGSMAGPLNPDIFCLDSPSEHHPSSLIAYYSNSSSLGAMLVSHTRLLFIMPLMWSTSPFRWLDTDVDKSNKTLDYTAGSANPGFQLKG